MSDCNKLQCSLLTVRPCASPFDWNAVVREGSSRIMRPGPQKLAHYIALTSAAPVLLSYSRASVSYEYKKLQFKARPDFYESTYTNRKYILSTVCFVLNQNNRVHSFVTYCQVFFGYRIKTNHLEHYIRDLFRFARR
jgi:hypothetical protein